MTDGYKIKKVRIRQNGVEKQIYPASRLPSAYQEVEYIESSGTQYILTTLDIKDGYRCLAEIQITGYSSDWNTARIFGGYLGYDGKYRRLYLAGVFGNSSSNWCEVGYTDNYPRVYDININTNHILDFSWVSGNAFLIVDGTTKYTSSDTYSTGLGGKVCLCGGYVQDANPQYNSPLAKRSYEKIYDKNGNIVIDAVPCYRKSDGVIGMYDLANNQFYTNSGSGTFTKGPNVS